MPSDRSRWEVSREDAGARLDKFLAAPDRLGSRARAAAAIERGKVYVNGIEASLAHAARALAPGDHVRVWIDRPGRARPRARGGHTGDLRIIFEDAVLLIADKPPGLLSVPLERNPGVPSLFDLVEEHFRPHGKRRPLVVHRIDQDTSGIVVFAKDTTTERHLQVQFKRREPERIYRAVVHGRPDPPEGAWRDRLLWDPKALIQKETHPRDARGTDALSEYRVLEQLRGASLIEVRLRTGRRNQIRIQACLHGHPLVGETRYTGGFENLRPIPFHRYALHAYRLAFRHPGDDRRVEYVAPLPADFRDLLRRLRL
jgi:23S rRNA pseudouridine1911/1915/1917 synthase